MPQKGESDDQFGVRCWLIVVDNSQSRSMVRRVVCGVNCGTLQLARLIECVVSAKSGGLSFKVLLFSILRHVRRSYPCQFGISLIRGA
jgi:hypothetical protein